MKPEQRLKADQRADFFATLIALGYTADEVGDRFRITATRVRQIVRRERQRRAQEFDKIGIRLLIVEATLRSAFPKVISKVSAPLIDTGSDPTIASGGST